MEGITLGAGEEVDEVAGGPGGIYIYIYKMCVNVIKFFGCMIQNFRLGKSLPHMFNTDDVPVPQNAPPKVVSPSGDLLKYLSLGSNGQPLLTTLKPGSTTPPPEEEWSDRDYLDLPAD